MQVFVWTLGSLCFTPNDCCCHASTRFTIRFERCSCQKHDSLVWFSVLYLNLAWRLMRVWNINEKRRRLFAGSKYISSPAGTGRNNCQFFFGRKDFSIKYSYVYNRCILTFKCTRIVIYSCSTTNKMYLFLKFFILVKRSTCFGRPFRPSSGAQNCTYGNGHMSNSCCYLLLGGNKWN